MSQHRPTMSKETHMRRMITIGSILALVVALVALATSGTADAKGNGLPKLSKKADRNRDRLPDKWEKRFRLSLRVNEAGKDQDGDGLDNAGEFQAGTSPRDRDSDDDG